MPLAPQLFMDLDAGTYISQRRASRPSALLRKLLGSDGGVVLHEGASLARGATVELDVDMFRLVMSEALSNARKFHVDSAPIEIHMAHNRASGELVVTMRNSNEPRPTVPTAEECEALFEAGARGGNNSAGIPSDGIGLNSVRLAARGAHGSAQLSMTHTHTTFRFTLSVGPAIPAATSQDTEVAVVAAAEHGVARNSSLVCFGIDDDELNREVHTMLFKSMGAAALNTVVVGGTVAEQDGFVARVLERRPDVVLLDENLQGPDGTLRLLGSDLAAELHAAGFRSAVVCILTASADSTVDELRAKPGVDLAFSKGCGMKWLAAELLRVVAAKRREGGVTVVRQFKAPG